MGFAGFVGVLSGFNNAGLFAAILDAPMLGTYPQPPTGKRSYVFDLRNALETATDIETAAGRMAAQPYAYSHNVLWADSTSVKVQEHPQDVNAMLRSADSVLNADLTWGRTDQVAVVNCFALSGFFNVGTDFNFVRWNRLRDLAVFSPTVPATVEDVAAIMLDTANGSDNAIFRSGTLQTMVFATDSRKLILYTAPTSGIHPAEPVLTRVQVAPLNRGDVNDDGRADLADAVLALQVLSRCAADAVRPDFRTCGADVDDDRCLGGAEVAFILQRLSELR